MNFFLKSLMVLIINLSIFSYSFAEITVVVKPSKGKPAEIITIEGKGFKPQEEIEIVFVVSEDEKAVLGTERDDVIKTDSNGNFLIETGIPITAKPGNHKIEISGNKGSFIETYVEVVP